ncbi:MAG: OB-fold domain-containing protein [Chloroflexota bacterium]
MKKPIEIVAYKCKKCGKVHYPFHDRCLGCKGQEFEKIAPQGEARLLTYTQIFNLPWGFDQRYLVLGVAEFENGVKAMGQIKADSLDGLKVGMPVHPVWEPVRVTHGEDVYGLKFEPLA